MDSRASGPLRVQWLGRVDFAECLEAQLSLRDAIVAGEAPETLMLAEHPPTVTLGRRATPRDLLWDPAQLRERGVSLYETPRGGEATLHAPGQLVAYPIVRVGRQIRQHIVRMAEVTIDLFASLGAEGLEFRMEYPGVWRGPDKIASIGIHVRRGVSVQGISMNVDVDPTLFGALVSCGMREVEMFSLAHLVPKGLPSLEVLAGRWAARWSDGMGRAVPGFAMVDSDHGVS